MSKIAQPVKLGFDPTDPTLFDNTKEGRQEAKTLKAVFDDREARIIWLAIKSGHIVSQDFAGDCLRIAKALRKFGAATPLRLGYLCRSNSHDGALHFLFCVSDSRDITGLNGRALEAEQARREQLALVTELYDYLIGRKPFFWQVSFNGQNEGHAEGQPAGDWTIEKPNRTLSKEGKIDE